MKFLFTVSLICLSAIPNIAQKSIDAGQEEAKNIKNIFKDDELVATESHTSLTFLLDKGGKNLQVREKEHYRYLSLRANTSYLKKNFYGDHSSLEEYTLRNDRGKNIQHDKICGHYQQQDIFYSDAQVCAFRINFNLMGELVNFESSTLHEDPRYVTYAYFHDEIPAQKREINISIPAWANVELLDMNFEGYEIVKKIKTENGNKIYSYSIENLESISKESHLPGNLLYLPHVLILTKSYQQKGETVKVLSSTADLYNWYSELTKNTAENYDILRPKVAELTKSLTKDEDKIKAIYYWVQDNIKYIAFEDGVAAFKPEEAHEVFYNRYGDCKGMANLTKAMLHIAGYDARLTWIGTDRIPYDHNIPSLAVDNHMICSVLLNDKVLILDATEKYNPFGTYAERIQGKEILIENGKDYMLRHVPVEPLEKYLQESNVTYTIDGGRLKGEGLETIKGEYKKILLNLVFNMKDDDREKLLKMIVSGASDPDNFVIRNHPDFDREKTLQIGYHIELKNHLNYYDKEIYVDMDFADEYKEVVMKDDRKVPYKFDSKMFKKTRAELKIPPGFKLTYLPKPFTVKNEYFTFDLTYSVENNKIVYNKEIRIQKSILPVAEFTNWNAAIKGIRNFYNDQIILESND